MMHGSLPARLQVLRARQGLTLVDAAEQIGIGRDTLSDLEKGHRHPVMPTLRKIAEGYGVPVEDLLEEPALVGKADAPDQGPKALHITPAQEPEEVLPPVLEHVNGAFDALMRELRNAGVPTEGLEEVEELRTRTLERLR